ncbi:MAG: methionine--tRNA ligase [Synechococcales cyanobacterium RM1_1_8]|nr:methionine--tRNA ligase [Synechococcales cyanobacterium RM1_1_8]
MSNADPKASAPSNLAPFAATTPLYYVNDVPHVGSAYTTMALDSLCRYQRLRGRPTLMVTGTDEHGQKIQRTAEKHGRSPQEHCDQIVGSFQDLWQQLNIRYDRFSRTTDERHRAIVTEFYQRVEAQGDIYLSQQQGFYCVGCEEFKEKRDLIDEKFCPLHPNQEAEWRDEENYFFRLSNYQEKLEALYAANPDFIQPPSRRNEVLSFVSQGLKDFSISRINLDWGFPVPGDARHTLYVWFDALLGYVTALLEPEDEPTLENATARWFPFSLHLIGKDILRFHAVYWPAMLMSAGLPVSDRVFGHGFLTKDGQKMGKSLGNVLDPVALINRYGSDAVRYYFLKEIEFGRDGDFSEARFVDTLNADLANDLGNLLNRTLGMAKRYCDLTVPQLSGEDFPADHPLRQMGDGLGDRIAIAYEALAFREVCTSALSLAQACNKFLDQEAPWSRYKEGNQAAVESILYAVLESVRQVAYLLSPVVPNLANAIYQQLGYKLDFNAVTAAVTGGAITHKSASLAYGEQSQWGCLPGGQLMEQPSPIFAKLELESV